MKPTPKIYKLTVCLNNSDHPFWRTFLTKNTINFYRLHLELQSVLNWNNESPFRFHVNDLVIGDPQETFLTLKHERNARSTKLGTLLNEESQSFLYEYDPVSKWQHTITLNQTYDQHTFDHLLPHCLDGQNSRPPENFGGIKKFNKFAKDFIPGISKIEETVVMGEHEEKFSYDPYYFDKDHTNLQLNYTFNFKAYTERRDKKT